LAFFSGTDNNDDKSNYCYSGVVGKLNDPSPSTIWRLNLGEEKHTDIKVADIFENQLTLPAVPQEWLDKVTVQSYPMYSGAYGGAWGDEWYQKNGHGRGPAQNVASKGPNGLHWAKIEEKLSDESYSKLLAALGEKFVEYLELPPTRVPVPQAIPAPSNTFNPDDAMEVFLNNVDDDHTKSLVRMSTGMSFLDSSEYPGLRTLGVYEYLIIYDQLMAITDDCGQSGLYINGIAGIIPVEAFIKNDSYLNGYAAYVNTHGVSLAQVQESVLMFVEHITSGVVY